MQVIQENLFQYVKDSGLVTKTSRCDYFRAEEVCCSVSDCTLVHALCSLTSVYLDMAPTLHVHVSIPVKSIILISKLTIVGFLNVLQADTFRTASWEVRSLTRTKGFVFSMERKCRYCCPKMPLEKIWKCTGLHYMQHKIITKGGKKKSNNIFCNRRHKIFFLS